MSARTAVVMLAVVFVACVWLAPAWAQEAGGGPAAGAQTNAPREISILKLIQYSGPIGWLIIVISFVAVALVVEDVRVIRRDRLMPPQTVTALKHFIARGQYREALVRCEQEEGFITSVVGAGLSAVGSGAADGGEVQTAMVEAGEEQASRLYRKIEYLSLIGNVAPMMGLLGTVTGMILAFNKIAFKEELVRPSDLAHGISQALVTTCMGLIVAIPTMFFVSFFRNRIDSTVAEAEAIVEKLMGQFRKTGAE